MKYIFDIEADNLLDKITKIHCLSYYCIDNYTIGTLINYEDIKNFLKQKDLTLIGHNIIRYDIPALNKILNIEIKAKLIDTLPIAWVIDITKKKHGLEEYGEQYGILKPEVKDWSGLTIKEYSHRCQEDVKINTKLWLEQLSYLRKLYDNDEEIYKYLSYLSFKMDCVREQEEIGIKIDKELCKTTLDKLTIIKEEKSLALNKAMPKVAVKKKKVFNNAVIDENGNLFQKGDLFFNSVDINLKPKDIEQSKIIDWKDPNSNSHTQLKDWLYSLGWVPQHIKHQRNKKTNEVKKIPQISSEFVKGEVCDSIKELFIKEPKLELLNGLFVLSHRLSIFKGFLENIDENNRLYPTCMGLTNTLRLQHAEIVNLPGIDKLYGKEVRSCLIADEGKILCGSDLSGIEDNTKRHYIYKYDPKYVEEMNTEGYDPHLDIGVKANLIQSEDIEFFKWFEQQKKNAEKLKIAFTPTKEEKDNFTRIKDARQKAKTVNFSATYKVGAETLSRNGKFKLSFAKKLLKTFWERNKAILQIENALEIKQIGEQKWLKNPVSGFWYSLRSDKDKFSTLNQGTAGFCFDNYVAQIRKLGVKISYQCHDEWLANVTNKEETNLKIKEAIKKVNNYLKLNIEIKCSADFSNNYADCH